MLGELAQLGAHGIDGQADDLNVMCRNGRGQNAREIVDFLQPRLDAVLLFAAFAITDRSEIRNQIISIRRRESKRILPIKVAHHLIIGAESTIVKIRRVEIGIHQSRCLERAAASHVVLKVIDEAAGGHVTSRAA